MAQLTFLLEEPPARISASPGSGPAWLASAETSHSSFFVWLRERSRAGWFGKMSPASCRSTADGHLAPSSGRWQTSGMGSPTGFLTLSTSSLAQRRARVFVVGCLGDWRRAAAVLFEPESLLGHPAPSRQAGQRVARPIAASAPGSSGYRNDADTADNLIAGTLRAAQPARAWRGDGAELIAGAVSKVGQGHRRASW
jgi:hypothetical protein